MTADHIIDQCVRECQYGEVDRELADDIAYAAWKKIITLMQENDLIKTIKGFDYLRQK